MKPTEFLLALFGEDVGDSKILIWTIPHKTSYWFDSTIEAGKKVAELAKEQDVYFGIGLSPKDYGKAKRCKIEDISGLYGLHIDLDYLHGVHTNTNLAPSYEDAVAFVSGVLPPHLKPSLIVHTGHGIHAHWIFKEPWIFEDAAERKRASKLSTEFCLTLKGHAAAKGWHLDSTFDLARVLRIPGTWNRKNKKNPIEVTAVHVSEARFNPEDFEEVISEEARDQQILSESIDPSKNPLGIVISIFAEPSREKMETMLETNDRFREAYEMRDRRKDQSPSSYEMSLANIAVDYGWSSQEVANLLISFRRKHFGESSKQFQKAVRIDYLNRTILKAIKSIEHQGATERLAEMHMELQQHVKEPKKCKPPEGETIRDQLQHILGIKINKIYKYVGDTPIYEIELEDNRQVQLGDVTTILNQGKLRAVIAAHCNLIIDRVQPALWDRYAQLLLFACEEKTTGIETSDRDLMRSLIREYIDDHGVADNLQLAIQQKMPYKYGHKTFIFGKEFRHWLKMSSEAIGPKQFGLLMAKIGAKNKNQKFIHGSTDDQPKTTSRSVYDVTKILGQMHITPSTRKSNVTSIFKKEEEEDSATGHSDEEIEATHGPYAGETFPIH